MTAEPERYASEAEALADALPPYANALPSGVPQREPYICDDPRLCGESTSAALRRVEQERDALLSANSFLDGVAATALDERDIARADLANTRAAFDLAEELRLKVTAELVSARTELDAVRTARDTLDQLLAEARTEIQLNDAEWKLCPRCGIELNADLSGGTPALASWIVARDGGRDCVSCGREIRRGEAYELMSGADQLQHVHCRDEPEVVVTYDAWHCDAGHRYPYPKAATHDHCDRPLLPVRVTITRRTEEHETA